VVSAIKYRPDIDGLRALAVVSVVLYHVNPESMPGGFLGVDVFFVISGYLISLIIFHEQALGTFSFSGFYVRRIRRLFPALMAVLLATIGFGAVALFADEYQRLGKHAVAALLFLLNIRLMSEAGYFDVVSDAKPLLHLWSLSVEEQFYLAWPALIFVLGRLRLNLGWAITAGLGVSFVFALVLAESNVEALYFHPLARFWELLLGVLLAYWHQRIGVDALPDWLASTRARHAMSCLGLAAILVALFHLSGKTPHPGALTLIPLLGVAALIASGQNALGNRVLSLKPIVWIGLISYPLYLWHWPLLSYVRIVESGAPSPMQLWLAAGMAVFLSALTYRFLERPLRHSYKVRAAVLGLGTAMICLLIISVSIVVADGFRDRSSVRHAEGTDRQMRREAERDESCLRLFPPAGAPVYCRQSGTSDRMIAIVGDSHAHVLFPGFAEQAKLERYGVLMLANSGCPPFLGAVTGKTEKERRECALSVENILHAVLNDQRIKHVVLATRGPIYLTGRGYGPAEADYRQPPIAFQSSGSGKDEKGIGPFSMGLSATVHQLVNSGLAVSYFLQVPELGVSPGTCMGRPFARTSAPSCMVPVGAYMDRMHEYRKILARMQVLYPRLAILDPQPLLCDSTHCRAVLGNKLLYADDDHLSVEGSRVMAAHFFSLLRLPH
jgi:peptidoglycan/LPS O-acetylase OafA/YrhL